VATSSSWRSSRRRARRRRLRVDTLLIARTDANSATLLTSDCDDTTAASDGRPHHEGFFRISDGIESAIARALAYAPYAICCGSRRRRQYRGATRFAAAMHAATRTCDCAAVNSLAKRRSVNALSARLTISVRAPSALPRSPAQCSPVHGSTPASCRRAAAGRGEPGGFLDIGRRPFEPQQIGIRRIRQSPRDALSIPSLIRKNPRWCGRPSGSGGRTRRSRS